MSQDPKSPTKHDRKRGIALAAITSMVNGMVAAGDLDAVRAQASIDRQIAGWDDAHPEAEEPAERKTHHALHASDRHDDFSDHAVPMEPEGKGETGAHGAYKSPPGREAPHASERHDDFSDHAVHMKPKGKGEAGAHGAYKTPPGRGAVHVQDHPEHGAGFRENFFPHPGPTGEGGQGLHGAWVSRGATPET